MNQHCLKLKLKMKIRTLVITLSVAAMATVNVMAGGILSPHAADNQTKAVNGYNSDPSLTANGLPSAPPHVVDGQTKTVPGKSKEVNPSIARARHASGSPKMIGECASQPGDTMSCCAPTK